MRAWVVLVVIAGCSESRELSAPCVDCTARVHPAGILDPLSDDFHGLELARRDWDFALCATCHGEAFAGGTSGNACTTCHVDGPTACVTCHLEGPTSGAHVAHRRAQLACAECHAVPATWDAAGHIVGDSAPAEVVLGARAQLTPVAADRKGPPTFEAGTCANVYCHGDALHAPGGTATQPRWDDPAPSGTCGRCHGAPPPSHAQSACGACHPASAPHLDGAIQIGTTSGCDGCHGSASSPAPPRDLAGNQFTTALGVGAHQAHLGAPSGLRGPIACATCHLVPTSLAEPGHIDTALPAEVAQALGWDRTTASCATAWCHGPARPTWTATGGATCGSCHGIPPATASHLPGIPLTSCVSCHPDSVTPSGSILLTPGPNGPTSAHMDGDVDAL